MSAENPADTVIEQAAKVGAEAIYWTLEWEQLDDETRSDAIEFARALHDAGLLVDPADRDELRSQLRRARQQRAEAEVAELRATVDRVRALADGWDARAVARGDTGADSAAHAASELRAALDGGWQR